MTKWMSGKTRDDTMRYGILHRKKKVDKYEKN